MPEDGRVLAIRSTGPHGAVTAHVCATGASLCDLAFGGRAVIPSSTDDARTTWFHGVSLAPWPNRLRGAEWTLDGEQLRGAVNDPRGNGLHGLVFARDFEVVQQDEGCVRFATTIGKDPVYPWPLRVEVSYSVDAEGLTCSIGACNLSERTLPVAVGAHPYLAFDDASSIRIPAMAVCENDSALIPTGRLLAPSLRGLLDGAGTPLTGLLLDDCFTQLARDEAGIAHTLLTLGDGTVVDLWQDAEFGYTQVYILRDFPWADAHLHGIAIEPQSAPANALQTGEDLKWLAPGASWAANWGIAYTRSLR